MSARALVLLGPGTNRDRDIVEAIELAGGRCEVLPLEDLGRRPSRLLDYGLLVVPGGFSYGDALGAGSLLALDLRKRFGAEVAAFVASGRPVLGVCNGFQALVKAGMLPGTDIQEPRRRVTLAANALGRFECRWVRLAAPASRSLWTQGLEEGLACPVAHGEGRIAVDVPETLGRLHDEGRIALVYAGPEGGAAGGAWPANPNGSAADIAGLCNAQGNVLGLMPHPENGIRTERAAAAGGGRGRGCLRLFENGLAAARSL